jgi:hypothetical protein
MALFVRRRWPGWVAAAAVLLAVAGSTVWLTHRDHRPSSPGPVAATTPPPLPDTEPPPSPIAQVLARAGGRIATYDGMPVAATAVEVRSFVSGSAVFVGPSDAQRVLAVLVTADKVFQVRAGDRLTFTGAVRAVTPEFAQALGLSPPDLALVVKQGAYVEVTDFTVG